MCFQSGDVFQERWVRGWNFRDIYPYRWLVAVGIHWDFMPRVESYKSLTMFARVWCHNLHLPPYLAKLRHDAWYSSVKNFNITDSLCLSAGSLWEWLVIKIVNADSYSVDVIFPPAFLRIICFLTRPFFTSFSTPSGFSSLLLCSFHLSFKCPSALIGRKGILVCVCVLNQHWCLEGSLMYDKTNLFYI